MKATRFDHEKLTVYQRSLGFIVWLTEILERVPSKLSAHSQLDRASTSIPLNIAEGNGRFTPSDRCRFFDIARGSTLECAAALDVLVAKKILTETEIAAGKADLAEMTAMLIGLIRSNSDARLHEGGDPFEVEPRVTQSVSYRSEIKNKIKSKIKNPASAAIALILIFFLILISPAQSADWPQWGGRNSRNMYSPERGLPDAIGKIDFKPGTDEISTNGVKNLKWVAKLGSQSYGNVTVAGGKVFIGTNNEPPRDPRHDGDRSILLCFDEKTGKFLWQLVVPKLASGKVNDWESLGLLSSPTVEGDRVYLVTSRCEVICLDVNGMANGNDGPFTDEAHYVVKDVLLDRGKPTEHKAPPIPPGPQDADIICTTCTTTSACSRTTPRTVPCSSWTTSFTPAPPTARTGPTRTFRPPTRPASSRSTKRPANSLPRTRLTSARIFSTANGVRPPSPWSMAGNSSCSGAATVSATPSTPNSKTRVTMAK